MTADTALDPGRIRAWHAHVYFHDAAQRALAGQLREAVAQRFTVQLGRWRDGPIGPHTVPMFMVAFTPAEFDRVVPWLALNRQGLDILLHPQTLAPRADHLRHALWLGMPQPLATTALAEAIDADEDEVLQINNQPHARRGEAPLTAEALRALQAPIKARYKAEPATARHTFEARGTLLPGQPACRIHTRFARYDAGLHPAAGGDGQDACSGDLLLESLVACAGVTFNVVATALGVPFHTATVVVEGDGDFRGTLGVARDAPVGLTDIRVRFEVDSPAGDEQLATLLQLTERYCVIAQTLQHSPRISTTLRRVSS